MCDVQLIRKEMNFLGDCFVDVIWSSTALFGFFMVPFLSFSYTRFRNAIVRDLSHLAGTFYLLYICHPYQGMPLLEKERCVKAYRRSSEIAVFVAY